jgi:hypothetical protein
MTRPISAAREPGWQVDPGRYHLHVGRSSDRVDHVVALEIVPRDAP